MANIKRSFHITDRLTWLFDYLRFAYADVKSINKKYPIHYDKNYSLTLLALIELKNKVGEAIHKAETRDAVHINARDITISDLTKEECVEFLTWLSSIKADLDLIMIRLESLTANTYYDGRGIKVRPDIEDAMTELRKANGMLAIIHKELEAKGS